MCHYIKWADLDSSTIFDVLKSHYIVYTYVQVFHCTLLRYLSYKNYHSREDFEFPENASGLQIQTLIKNKNRSNMKYTSEKLHNNKLKIKNFALYFK